MHRMPAAGAHARIVSMRYLAPAAAGLLVVDLFLPWQRIGVDMPYIDVDTTSTGWGGWGTVAGICALVLIVLALAQRSMGPVTRAALGVLLPVFTALAALTGDAHVMSGMMNVDVGETLWAAWVGLGLAVVAGAATLAPLVSRPADRSQPHPA
jgi:hypothetical protein